MALILTKVIWTSSSIRQPTLPYFDLGAIRCKLRTLLGVPVDILTPNSLPDSFRESVISEAQPI
jgi:predicted nucleotidyltransferase